ncbi:hypothetical protein LCGC14_1206290 [marine sediment metagenome]|uniref:Uncharacterized protein n=1 Tax=marine sediment metagenome TaxID=412755 RepID=A0A0F9PK38_9ZZZZ
MKINIDEAIKALELDKTCDFEGDQQILEASLQLGIEALNQIKELRTHGLNTAAPTLPGETDETTQPKKA